MHQQGHTEVIFFEEPGRPVEALSRTTIEAGGEPQICWHSARMTLSHDFRTSPEVGEAAQPTAKKGPR